MALSLWHRQLAQQRQCRSSSGGRPKALGAQSQNPFKKRSYVQQLCAQPCAAMCGALGGHMPIPGYSAPGPGFRFSRFCRSSVAVSFHLPPCFSLPLFLSPQGVRVDHCRPFNHWRGSPLCGVSRHGGADPHKTMLIARKSWRSRAAR